VFPNFWQGECSGGARRRAWKRSGLRRTLNATVSKVDNLVWLPIASKRENWSRGPTVDDFCAGTHGCRPKSRGPRVDHPGLTFDLQKVLKCFKINRPAGIALSLVDSGSTCFLTPLDEHLIVRYACATPITGIGNSTGKNYSPMIMGAVTSTGHYHVMHYPRIYEMKSLDFTIVSTPALERCGYEFRLNANSSRMITPGGEVVPLVRDPGTGFHFLVDHLQRECVVYWYSI